MTTLAADKLRDFDASIPPAYEHYPVIASDIIYEGALVALDGSGNAKNLEGTDTQFVGIATAKADNSAGAAAAINVQVRTKGKFKADVTGVSAKTDVGSKVYATDDNTLTLSSTGALLIGKVARWIGSSTTCIVAFEACFYDTAT